MIREARAGICLEEESLKEGFFQKYVLPVGKAVERGGVAVTKLLVAGMEQSVTSNRGYPPFKRMRWASRSSSNPCSFIGLKSAMDHKRPSQRVYS